MHACVLQTESKHDNGSNFFLEAVASRSRRTRTQRVPLIHSHSIKSQTTPAHFFSSSRPRHILPIPFHTVRHRHILPDTNSYSMREEPKCSGGDVEYIPNAVLLPIAANSGRRSGTASRSGHSQMHLPSSNNARSTHQYDNQTHLLAHAEIRLVSPRTAPPSFRRGYTTGLGQA
jgi:hypothetical protein